MTYSPSLPVTPREPHNSARTNCSLLDILVRRVSCLLHCPADTPELWPQVLSIMGSALDCESVQLFLPAALSTDGQYTWTKGAKKQPTEKQLTESGIPALSS
ncbi:MAG: hypothetical protein AAF703_23630 [Cyanobacteria bacterium P01_D01_bin.105]